MFATAVQPMAPSDQFNHLIQILGQYREEAVEERKENQQARHALRGDINAKIDGLSLEVKALRSDLTGADKRVLVLETHRAIEEKTAQRRGTWAGLIAGGAITGLFKFIDWVQGR